MTGRYDNPNINSESKKHAKLAQSENNYYNLGRKR